MKDNTLPEEKLLSLIKKNDAFSFKGKDIKKGPVLGILQTFYKIVERANLNVWINKIIIISCCLSLFFLFITFAYSLLPFKGIRVRNDKAKGVKISLEKIPEEPLEFYLDQIRAKDIFNNSAIQKDGNGDILLDAIREIALVGIIRQDPVQAIIKDKKSGDIYYLKKNETIREFKILDILEGKIIIEYRGERFEVHL